MLSRDGARFDEDDTILPFQVADTAVRGRIVRLGPTIDHILSAHAFPDSVSELVGEAVALVALMGAALKFDGKLVFQVQGDGPMRMLVADYTAGGGVRATASLREDPPPGARGLKALAGAGHMALTIDQGADMDRYQGVTGLEGESLAAAAEAYFRQSEQIPTAVSLAVGRVQRPGQASLWRAGGVIAQFVPAEGGERERGEAVLASAADAETWDRAAALLATTQADELLDPGLGPDRLLYRLYHEDGVRVFEPARISFYCSCNAEKIAAVLQSYAPDELVDMVEDGLIRVDCEFCRRRYNFDKTGNPAAAA